MFQLRVRPEERLLHNVVRILLVSHKSIGHLEDGPAMELHQHTEGVAVARQYPLHCGSFLRVHHPHRLKTASAVMRSTKISWVPVIRCYGTAPGKTSIGSASGCDAANCNAVTATFWSKTS